MAKTVEIPQDCKLPLYKEWQNFQLPKYVASGNAGLCFDKFGNAWRELETLDREGKLKPEFDKGVGRDKQGANVWLQSFCTQKIGEPSRVERATERQRQLIESLGGVVLQVTNESRFVTGMGRTHPKENGFAWHHTLGVPYLPSSGIKGMLTTWCRELWCDWDDSAKEGKRWKAKDETHEKLFKSLFGDQETVGNWIFFDLLPVEPVELVVEIMTPHYGDYYQDTKGKTIPGDWLSPNPISFLAVEASQHWQLGFAPRPSSQSATDSTVSETLNNSSIEAHIKDALSFLGLGAKTAVGYGRFDRDVQREEQLEAARQKRIADEKLAADAVAAKAKQDAEDAKLPAAVRAIVQLSRSQGWFEAQDPNAFLNGMESYLQETPSPSTAVVVWLKEQVFESGQAPFASWKGHWAQPEAQNKKGKYKLKSGRARAIILKLQQFESDAR